MEKEILNYEDSKTLYNLGFRLNHGEYIGEYRDGKFTRKPLNPKIFEKTKEFAPAPLYQQVFRWFRLKHGLDATISLVGPGYGYYIHHDRNYTNKGDNYGVSGTMYEDAQIAAIKKMMSIIKNPFDNV